MQASCFAYGDFKLEQHKIINYVIVYIQLQSLIDPGLLAWQLVAITYPTDTDHHLLHEKGNINNTWAESAYT